MYCKYKVHYCNGDTLLQVTDSCEMKIPNFFNITVMTSDRVVIKTVQHDYQSRSQVRIELPQNVDMCSLHVNISAGNSAGMSSPTEIEVGRSHVLNDKTKLCIKIILYLSCTQNVPL